ncbi:MAG: hypothetical protein V2I24_14355 [Halieaceae bacterium]|jgi:hypothetical protein|nr:hypothetical protein [Halieaceae bacterium]
MYNGDVLIHLDEAFDDQALHRLLRETGENPGVIGACINERARHLMVVDFDAEATRPSEILRGLRQRGVSAELIGL